MIGNPRIIALLGQVLRIRRLVEEWRYGFLEREREREHVADYVVSRILCNNVYERVGYYLYEIQSIFYLRMPSFERKSSCNVRVTRYTVHAPYSITINSAKISKVNESYLFPSRIKKTNV